MEQCSTKSMKAQRCTSWLPQRTKYPPRARGFPWILTALHSRVIGIFALPAKRPKCYAATFLCNTPSRFHRESCSGKKQILINSLFAFSRGGVCESYCIGLRTKFFHIR